MLGDLQAGLSISPLEALDRYGVMRLAAIIHNLRRHGHNIRTDTRETLDGKRYAVYTLINPMASQPELPF